MASFINLQEVIQEEHLKALEIRFLDAQELNVGIDFEFFKMILAEIVGDILPDSELWLIFNKIDNNSTGFIDWNGFISYVLSELQMRQEVKTKSEAALKSAFHVVKTGNQDAICQIGLMPYVSSDAKIIDYTTGRYVVVTKDGYISFWTQSWQMQKTKQCQEPTLNRSHCAWMIDMVCLPNVFVVAVASADETIKFYDSASSKMEVVSMLVHIDSIVTCLDYVFNPSEPQEGFLTFGDSNGNVTILHFLNCMQNKMFGSFVGKRETQVISFRDILQDLNEYCKILRFNSLHKEWVKQVRFLPRLKSLLSCSTHSETAMILQGTILEMTKRTYRVNRGINCFDYNDDLAIIASGGIDRCLRLWNPFFTNKPIATFFGHSTPITQVRIIEEVHQVISVSADKCLKVWDIKDQACIQSVLTHTVDWGSYPISAVFHNEFKRQLVLATSKIVVVERVWEGIGDDNTFFMTHSAPITGMIYSEIYDQVVTTCEQGVISFWDVESGRRNIHLPNAHWLTQDGIQIACVITAIAIDETKKKLITAGIDYLIKMWNLSNGALLRTLAIPDQQEITVIVSIKHRVFFAGWHKRVYICNDSLDPETVKAWPLRHSDDILHMTYLSPNLIVTSSWDGRTKIWMLEFGSMKSTLTLQQFFTKKNLPFPPPGLLTGVSFGTLSFVSTAKSSITTNRKSDSISSKYSPASTVPSSGTRNLSFKTASVKSKLNKGRGQKIFKMPKNKSSVLAQQKTQFPAVTCLQCLVKREVTPKIGNLFMSDVTGMIQVWSTHVNGGPLAVFVSVNSNSQYTTCMTTDVNNKYLVTGDSKGYIRFWYIRYYYSEESEEPASDLNPDIQNFPFMRTALEAVANKATRTLAQLTPTEFSPYLGTEHPTLLSCYRGHCRRVVQTLILEEKQLLLSASTDQTVRIWTLDGRYLVTFGDGRGWNLTKLLTMHVRHADRKAPPDIRKVGSAVTLQVLMGGRGHRWWKLRELFLFIYIKAIMRKSRANRLTGSDGEDPSMKPQEKPEVQQPSKSSMKQQEKPQIVAKFSDQPNMELELSDMISPLGKYFSFKTNQPKVAPLPSISKAKKDMNAVYSYIKHYPLQSTNIDEVLSLVSPRVASKLKTIKGTKPAQVQ